MKAFKYMMIDVIKVRAQLWSMVIFGILAYFYSRNQGISFGIPYMLFVVALMQGAVFTYDQKSETGYINLLPGTDMARVAGRYMLGIFYTLIGLAEILLNSVILYFVEGIKTAHLPEITFLFLGVILIFLAIQNVTFYSVGKGNSQQVMHFIHMIPSFVLLFPMFIFSALLSEGEVDEEMWLLKIVEWVVNHMVVLGTVMVLLGLALNLIGIFISAKIVAKKDYA